MEIKNSRRQRYSKQQNKHKHNRRKAQNREKGEEENNLKMSKNVSEVEETSRISVSVCDRTSFESLSLLPVEIHKQKETSCRTCYPSFAAITSPWNIDEKEKMIEGDEKKGKEKKEEEKKEEEEEVCSSGSDDPPTRCGLCERLQGPMTANYLDKELFEKLRRNENFTPSEERLGIDGDSESEANKRRRRGRKRELEGGTKEFLKDSTATRVSKESGGFPGLYRAIDSDERLSDVGGRWIRSAASVVRWPSSPPSPHRIGIKKTDTSSINYLSKIKNRRNIYFKLSWLTAIIFFITFLNCAFVTSASAQSNNKIIDDAGRGTNPIESSSSSLSSSSTGIAKRDGKLQPTPSSFFFLYINILYNQLNK